jgi:hypothetical protein
MSSLKWEFACCEYWDELLRKYVDNVFCVLSRSVKCDLRNAIQICSLQKLFETIHSRDHAWSSHRQFFWSFNLTLDEWRIFILDYWVTYVCSRSVERRLWWDVKLDETSHQIWRKRLIKLDESDSSNLTKETSSHQTLTKASFHQTWDRRFIKFLKRKAIFLLSDERSHATTRDMRNLILQKITFVLRENRNLCKSATMISDHSQSMKAERWYYSTFSYKRRVSSYVKTINKWLLSFRQFELII